MRVMVMIKANKDSEAGVMPSEQLLAEMGKFNEVLVKAGVMLAGEGLHPSSKGKRVKFAGTKRTVIDGPFTNFTGTVDEVRADRGRVKVMISVFGRPTPVELEFTQLEKI